ncbi:MAG: hypothetical protein Q4P32_05665 [Micrococcales bacterium]|nr:hypothetical protein [Micrococcales bacterium]
MDNGWIWATLVLVACLVSGLALVLVRGRRARGEPRASAPDPAWAANPDGGLHDGRRPDEEPPPSAGPQPPALGPPPPRRPASDSDELADPYGGRGESSHADIGIDPQVERDLEAFERADDPLREEREQGDADNGRG